MKMRARINDIEPKIIIQRINKTKILSFEKNKQIKKPLANLKK
jgi:hypothetical protein